MTIHKLYPSSRLDDQPIPRPTPGSRPRLVRLAKAHPPAPTLAQLPALDTHGHLAAHFVDEHGQQHTMSMASTWEPAANDPQQRFLRMASFFALHGCTLTELRQTVQYGVEL